MILGELAAPPSGSLLDNFLGVEPDYLKKKLDALEVLMWLSVASGLSAAVVTAIRLRAAPVRRNPGRPPRRRRRRRR